MRFSSGPDHHSSLRPQRRPFAPRSGSHIGPLHLLALLALLACFALAWRPHCTSARTRGGCATRCGSSARPPRTAWVDPHRDAVPLLGRPLLRYAAAWPSAPDRPGAPTHSRMDGRARLLPVGPPGPARTTPNGADRPLCTTGRNGTMETTEHHHPDRPNLTGGPVRRPGTATGPTVSSVTPDPKETVRVRASGTRLGSGRRLRPGPGLRGAPGGLPAAGAARRA